MTTLANKKREALKTGLCILALGMVGLVGIWLVKVSTPNGLSLSDDSIAYIAGARGILSGRGYNEIWLVSSQPITHFPPMFSALLALLGLLGLDPLRGARLLNTLLFGASAILLGVLGWRMVRSRIAGLVLACLFIANSSLLRVHAYAFSESLFIFLSLIAFLLFDLYHTHDHGAWLVGVGVTVGLACLTRYAGLALLATFAIALVLLHKAWRKRIITATTLVASAIPWLLAWSLRNRILTGNSTNRTLFWHPVTTDNLRLSIYNFSEFIIPIETWRHSLIKMPGLFPVILITIGLALLAWVLYVGLKHFLRPSLLSRPGIITFTNGLYFFGYLGSILASMSLFDASTKFKLRILSPAYISLLILLVALGGWLWHRRNTIARAAVVLLGILVLSLSAFGQYITAHELMKTSYGYASWKWFDSKTMAAIRQLPMEISIYTDQPGPVYLYTGRACHVLPEQFDPVTAQVRPEFEAGVEYLRGEVLEGKAALVLFKIPDDEDSNRANITYLTKSLSPAQQFGGDVIYYYPAQP